MYLINMQTVNHIIILGSVQYCKDGGLHSLRWPPPISVGLAWWSGKTGFWGAKEEREISPLSSIHLQGHHRVPACQSCAGEGRCGATFWQGRTLVALQKDRRRENGLIKLTILVVKTSIICMSVFRRLQLESKNFVHWVSYLHLILTILRGVFFSLLSLLT